MTRWLSGLGLLALLGACATPQSPRPLPHSNVGIEAFSLSGRVAVKVSSRGYSSGLRWRHSAVDDFLKLISPVGIVLADIESTGAGVTLTGADKKVYRSENVQTLTREILGWDLPLSGLKHWVLGRVDPEAAVLEELRDARNRLTRLVQSAWQIDYLAYAQDGALPASLSLTHGDLRLRLVVDRWDIPE